MYSLRNPLVRILSASALAIACMAPSGCYFVSNQEYDRLKLAEEHYSTVCKSNLDLQKQKEDRDRAIDVLADLNKEAVKLAEGKKIELTEQARLRYERDIEELTTDKIRLQRDKAFLEKHVAGYELKRTNFRTTDPEHLSLKERTSYLEKQTLDYKIETDNLRRENALLKNDNPEIQRLKEMNNLLEVQNSRYRTELDKLRGQLER